MKVCKIVNNLWFILTLQLGRKVFAFALAYFFAQPGLVKLWKCIVIAGNDASDEHHGYNIREYTAFIATHYPWGGHHIRGFLTPISTSRTSTAKVIRRCLQTSTNRSHSHCTSGSGSGSADSSSSFASCAEVVADTLGSCRLTLLICQVKGES